MIKVSAESKGSAHHAPFFIRSLLFPFTMLAVVLATHSLVMAGYDISLVLALVTFSGFFIVAVCERLWPLHREWNSNARGDLFVDMLHFVHNGFWVRLAETSSRIACA